MCQRVVPSLMHFLPLSCSDHILQQRIVPEYHFEKYATIQEESLETKTSGDLTAFLKGM